jgi:predicted ATPase/DNA-binding SARP family transcriptional activator/DNA-binding CsgD family transcriptional regulator
VAQRRPTAKTARPGGRAVPDGATEAVRVKLLGGFSVSVGAQEIGQGGWRLKKAAAMVKLLALSSDHRLHREQLEDLLWPGSGRKAASNSLRRTLHAARRTLDPAEGSRYLAGEEESLVLCPGGELWVDVDAFEQAAATARRSREPAAYRGALGLYAGDLLPEDRYEAWAEEKRGELRRLYLDLLVELARTHEERGDLGRALETLQTAVTEEPTLERAHAGLMRLYALLGQEGQALSQYQRLRDVLSRQLGTEPGSATRSLYEDLVSGRFSALPTRHAVVLQGATPDATRHNLPASRSSFVGRGRELIEIERTLAMTRLLTLTGAGGTGKTRLALEVARELVGAYPDGVWLVELAPLSEGELVAKVVAEALGVAERPQQPLTDTLADVLRDMEMLLVLDNCEHLVEAAAPLVEALLDSCARLRVLATSREALGMEGELRWPVSPLSVPELGRASSPEELEAYDSIRLFVERAGGHDPFFSLSPHNGRAVDDICRTLEGIPLAIELAAARVGALSLERISERLEGSIELLTRGSRTASPRQRTLRGTLDWSHDLLSGPEKVLFRRLSVFAGGWTLEASEPVSSGEGIEESEVLDLLSGLVEKSLVVVKGTYEGGMRYRLLEPVRHYALEKLKESGEVEAAKRAHAQYFLALSQEAEPELLGPREAQWYERLEEEHDNIRAALSWSLGAHPELGLRLAGAIWWFWHRHGHLREGLRWLEEGLAREGGASTIARAKVLGGIGWLAFGQGDLDRMRRSATEGLRQCAEAGLGGNHRALFLNLLGHASWQEGDYERATKMAEESLALSRAANDMGGMAESSLILGNASVWRLGGQEQARAYYEEGLAISRGEFGSASVSRALLNALGLTFLLRRDLERATELAEEVVALSQEAGDRTLLPLPLNYLGWVALLGGDLERAKALHKESLALSKELGGSLSPFLILEGLACDAEAAGEALRAARLFGAAQALRKSMGLTLEPAMRPLEEPYLLAARSQLAEGAWSKAWEEGRAMSMGAAIEYALSEEGSIATTPHVPNQEAADTRLLYLTHREEEVAVLVAQGLTNRQVAARLVISESTVETHLARIFKKLGLHSRSQLAVWVNARGPSASNRG